MTPVMAPVMTPVMTPVHRRWPGVHRTEDSVVSGSVVDLDTVKL
jgi:hypothetical protein